MGDDAGRKTRRQVIRGYIGLLRSAPEARRKFQRTPSDSLFMHSLMDSPLLSLFLNFLWIFCRAQEETASNTGLHLAVALSYGGQEDVVQATRCLAARVKRGEVHETDITHEMFRSELQCSYPGHPAPDLLIRCVGS